MTGMSNPPLAGRYVLVDQIGSGGMGSVWRAWDLRNQNFVAAKVLGQHDGSMLLRFVREQSVRIQHPHVVAPSGWAAEDNLVVFTMDLVRGGSVQTLLGDHGPLPESYVAVILDQTLQGLAAVHGAGVVHRDIKPANLLLEATGTRRPHVRLGDFGVAALIDEVRLTRFPGAIGTDGYMAPEQIHGASPDPRQDLYAAGVVAIQMLTGLAPRQQQGPPPGRLQPLLAALTSEDTETRPPTAAAALDWLRHLGVPTGAPWQEDPEPPEVFDQLGDVPPPEQSYPGSQPGSPSGAQSGDRSAVPSGVGAPQGAPSAAAYSQAPGSHVGPSPQQWQGGQSQGTGTRYANTHPGGRSIVASSAATTISMLCFAVALALSLTALIMLLA